MPCLMLRKGQVCLPGENGPVRIRAAHGGAIDPFDVIDRLRSGSDRLYFVDLDGIERGAPQLEYIQEFSRDMDLWVDAGVPTADAAIDIIVAGAQRAVLSSSYLRGPVELKRAWKLSTDWVFEVELVGGRVQLASPKWADAGAVALAQGAREVGIAEVLLSPREQEPDWSLVHSVAVGGSTWVDGTFTAAQRPRLIESGAAGGIFHINELIQDLLAAAPAAAPPASPVSPRDDED